MQNDEEILDRLIAEGEYRNWQDEPGTMISITCIEMQKRLEALRDEVFHLYDSESDAIMKRRLNRTYSHVSAAVKSMKG